MNIIISIFLIRKFRKKTKNYFLRIVQEAGDRDVKQTWNWWQDLFVNWQVFHSSYHLSPSFSFLTSVKFLFLTHYLRCLSKGDMVWNPCSTLQQIYLLEELHQPWILGASWLITYIIVIAYQKWQVFTVRDASYYKQKPRGPFLLVTKQASTFVKERGGKIEVCNIMIPINV